MTGRALVFSQPDVIQSIRERFVAATGDDWYRRRQEDAEGEFYRRLIAQRSDTWDGDSTRQGLYAFTWDGKLLAYRNTTDPKAARELLKRALDAWEALSESERKPAPFAAAAAPGDRRYARVPPQDGLVLRVHARELETTDAGTCRKAPPRGRFHNLGSLDHLWLRAEEWRRCLPPPAARAGDSYDLDSEVLYRVVRFHLLDNTRGEPPLWERADVHTAEATCTVRSVAADGVILDLSGRFDVRTRDAKRGYQGTLRGLLEVDRASSRFRRFDLIALGDHWGEGRYTGGARPGRSPLGVAITLATHKSAADSVPPQASRDFHAYFRALHD